MKGNVWTGMLRKMLWQRVLPPQNERTCSGKVKLSGICTKGERACSGKHTLWTGMLRKMDELITGFNSFIMPNAFFCIKRTWKTWFLPLYFQFKTERILSKSGWVCSGICNGCTQRAAYWRWAGFLALNFNRRTKVEFCTSVDTKPFSPPIANTMLN